MNAPFNLKERVRILYDCWGPALTTPLQDSGTQPLRSVRAIARSGDGKTASQFACP